MSSSGARIGLLKMTDIAELRREAIRARDEHGNTDFYMLLNSAADVIEDLCKQIDGCVKVVERQRDHNHVWLVPIDATWHKKGRQSLGDGAWACSTNEIL